MDNLISFKRSSSLLELESEIHYEKHLRQAKNTSQMSFCKVCGDKANIINYGALVCQSCKTFFRRNGLHPEVCSFNKCSSFILL